MKYTFKCPKCNIKTEKEISVKVYDKVAWETFCPIHKTQRMERVYFPAQLKFIGDGFTGAGGSIPHMDKTKRKKDLSENSGVEI